MKTKKSWAEINNFKRKILKKSFGSIDKSDGSLKAEKNIEFENLMETNEKDCQEN